MYEWNHQNVLKNIRLWLEEDIGSGDITTNTTIPEGHRSQGIIHVKENCMIAGLPIAQAVFTEVDPHIRFIPQVAEGSLVAKGDIVAIVDGLTHSILLGERLSLNLLQRLSGIATRTKQYVDATSHYSTRIVDTRKTTPGHRHLEKYAVRVGGGHNHRFGLYDAVMIKDNHIIASGSVLHAIHQARSQIPHTMKIEVEVENFTQLEQAIEASADIIMLDNMNLEDMMKAVSTIKSKKPHILVEASGSVTLDSVKAIAHTGVDIISIGRLTYSVISIDMSLDLNAQKEATS